MKSMTILLAAAAALLPIPALGAAAPKPPVGKERLPLLSYSIVTSGPADGAHPDRKDLVTVDYELTLLDGTVVDSSFKRGEPNEFPLDRLIPAWQILVRKMRAGDEWLFYVPPEYAYADRASPDLPANSFLVFRVKLLSFRTP